MARSVRPLRLAVAVVVVALVALSLTGCVADPPPIIGTATAGDGHAVVSWQPPLASMQGVVAYVVTPWVGFVGQTPVVFNSTATTQTVTGLTNGTTYAFTVRAVNALGSDSASSGMSNPVTPGPQIATGNSTCAIVAGGAVDCWGYNQFGELGDGTTVESHVPVAVTGLTGVTAVTAGNAHMCALLADGTVDCWGMNLSGQLGNGTTTESHVPVAVTGLTGVTTIAAGTFQTCAVVTTGAVYCWGSNESGRLGNGTTTNALTPTPVTGLTDAVDVAPGDRHACALMSDGTVYCWGYGAHGQIGPNSSGSLVPVVVSGVTGATAVAAGANHSCALVAGGAGKCWGENWAGELGAGVFSLWSSVPLAVAGLSGATSITAGGGDTCATMADGTAKCWGDNSVGQLGMGSSDPCDPDTDPNCHGGRKAPQTVVGLTQVTTISTGGCAMVAGGAAYCWGPNVYGRLGDGTTTWTTAPVAVIGL